MRRPLAPIEMIRAAAILLGDLRSEVAFLGGAAVGLLVTDPAAREPRATQDVDVIVGVATRIEYGLLEDRLRQAGFSNVIEGPICRFKHGDLILDVMPTLEEILGFSNSWYPAALDTAVWTDLGANVQGRVVTAPYFIATKLAAFESPERENHHDYLASRDIEDIVTVLDGRPEIVLEVRSSPDDARKFIQSKLRYHLEGRIEEAIEANLDADSVSRGRLRIVRQRIADIVVDQ